MQPVLDRPAYRCVGVALIVLLAAAAVEAQVGDVARAKETLAAGLEKATPTDLEGAVEFLVAARDPAAMAWVDQALGKVMRRHAKRAQAFEALAAKPVPPLPAGKRLDPAVRAKRLRDRSEKEAAARALLEADARSIDVLRRGLGRLLAVLPAEKRAAAAMTFVRRLRSTRKLEAKCTLIETLGHLGDPATCAALAAETRSRDPEVRIAAVDALGRQGDPAAVEALARCVGDVFWQVRAAAVQALRAIGGPAAVEALIAALAEADGRLGEDLAAALAALTGRNFRDNAALWRKWWAESKAGYSGPPVARADGEQQAPATTPGRPPAETRPGGAGAAGNKPPDGRSWRERTGGTAFYGIESRSKRLVYVLDISGSMLRPLGAAGPGQTGRQPRGGIGDRKIDQALSELRASLTALPADATFNLVFYHHEVTVWAKGQVKATPANREKAIDWAESQVATGATNIFGALERAFGLAGRGSFDRHYKVAADTFFLLSDGRATTGRYRLGSDMRRAVAGLNRFQKVKIHTIALGGDADAEFMHGLAQDTGGSFVHFGVRAKNR